ncbi:hypothetical protein [Duganella sp. HH105]|uniref:hypothetical protein n=1 Tax=Duganella sp. HH105 TaxID=1781067 RepID=UPI000877B495|nr:hypothetical protein [Duganella sp. HH105]
MSEQALYIHEETLQKHAYILLCQLMSMHDIENLAYYPGCHDAVASLMATGEPELNRNIMSLAALARANDDSRDGLKTHLAENPAGVGTLTRNEKSEILSAREACNKIIHNTSVRLTFETTVEHPLYAEAYRQNKIDDDREYRVPYLAIAGKGQGEGGKPWVARVDLIKWIFATALFGAA